MSGFVGVWALVSRPRVYLNGTHVSRVRGGADALRQQTDPLEPAGRRFANFFFVLFRFGANAGARAFGRNAGAIGASAARYGVFANSPLATALTLGVERSRLTWADGDLDYGVWPEAFAVTGMMLCVPVTDAPFDLAEKIEAALLRQVSEVADQVCDGMLVTSAAVPLKNGDCLGGPRNVVDFIGYASHRLRAYQKPAAQLLGLTTSI